MKCKATIQILASDSTDFINSFSAELQNPRKDRSSFKLVKSKQGAVFEIEANDPVALRAACDSILKLTIVYDKMKSIK